MCRYNDPPYVKIKKLEVLMQVCTEDNAQSIVEELGYTALALLVSVHIITKLLSSPRFFLSSFSVFSCLPLSIMAADVSSSVAQQAIQAIGSIAVRVSSRANMCVDKLMTLLSMEIDHITSEIIIIMASELGEEEWSQCLFLLVLLYIFFKSFYLYISDVVVRTDSCANSFQCFSAGYCLFSLIKRVHS